MKDKLKKNRFNLSKQKRAEKVEYMSVQTESITKTINKQDEKGPKTRDYNNINNKFQSLPISYTKRL